MQTFLPYPDFAASAAVLDAKRLGKQRVETMQIMTALVLGTGWIHHPATKMWAGHEGALLDYQHAICSEWTARGYVDTCLDKTFDIYANSSSSTHDKPYWFGDMPFHISHQSNLVRKDPEHYGLIFPGVPGDLPYIWPVPNSQENNMAETQQNLLFEDAKIMFRNFTGMEKQFNTEGKRNFCLFVDEATAEDLKALGLNVKYLKVREEGDEPQAYLKVNVNFGKGRPPHLVLVSSRGRTELDATTVSILDYADLTKVDLTINPYKYEIPGGNSGVSAYLKTGFFFLHEDELELKYADLGDAGPTTTLSSTASDYEEVG